MKCKILNNNFKLPFIYAGMRIKLSSFVKSVHKYIIINQSVPSFILKYFLTKCHLTRLF